MTTFFRRSPEENLTLSSFPLFYIPRPFFIARKRELWKKLISWICAWLFEREAAASLQKGRSKKIQREKEPILLISFNIITYKWQSMIIDFFSFRSFRSLDPNGRNSLRTIFNSRSKPEPSFFSAISHFDRAEPSSIMAHQNGEKYFGRFADK